MTDWKVIQGTQPTEPPAFDDASSPTTVYQRRNIRRVTLEDSISGETREVWQYEERTMSREEYEKMQLQAQVDALTVALLERS